MLRVKRTIRARATLILSPRRCDPSCTGWKPPLQGAQQIGTASKRSGASKLRDRSLVRGKSKSNNVTLMWQTPRQTLDFANSPTVSRLVLLFSIRRLPMPLPSSKLKYGEGTGRAGVLDLRTVVRTRADGEGNRSGIASITGWEIIGEDRPGRYVASPSHHPERCRCQ